MNMSDYEQYYQKGGTYVLPIEIFNELFGEMESWKKQSNQLQSNWNSLREWLEKVSQEEPMPRTEHFNWVYNNVLDYMNELEGVDNAL